MTEAELSTQYALEDQGTFAGAGGMRLFTRCWRPRTGGAGGSRDGESSSPSAVVALVHGISEHSGRYVTLIDHLTNLGFAICACDNRGHGKSPGQPGHIDRWSDYREDVHAFLDHVRLKFPGLPVFLYGHSLGALISSEYVLWHPEGLAGLIVSGIPLKPTGIAKPYLVALARMLSRVWPTFSVSLGVDATKLSRDPAAIKAYVEDPLVHHVATARWGTESLAAIQRVKARAHEITLPILIIHGGADMVNSVEGSKELFEMVSSADKQLRIYPGGAHEPHNDVEREQVVRDVGEWLERELMAA